MKNRCFLVVVFAVVCTVWNVAESQNCNNLEELEKCVSPLLAFSDMEDTDLNITTEERKVHLDRAVNRTFQCLDNYAQRCLTEETRHNYQLLYSRVTQVVKKLSEPGPYQEEFLTNAPCLAKVKDDVKHCVRTLYQKIREILAKMSNEVTSQSVSGLQAVCCSYRDYLVCIHGAVMEKCGEKTAKFVDDFINQISPSFMQEYCGSYDQCPGSSASRKSLRALLFP